MSNLVYNQIIHLTFDKIDNKRINLDNSSSESNRSLDSIDDHDNQNTMIPIINTTDVNITKMFFYCNKHDDSFFTYVKKHDPFKLEWSARSCLKNYDCDLIYIGLRTYDIFGNVIEDTTPNDNYFECKYGGYKCRYLNSASEIKLN